MAYIDQTGDSSTNQPPPPPPPAYFFNNNSNNGGSIPTAFITQSMPQQNYFVGGGRWATFYYRKTSIALGILFIVCGAGSILGGILAIAVQASWFEIGTGIWCGVIFVITGSIAIPAGRHLLDSLIIASTVFAFLSVAFGIVQLSLAIVGLLLDSDYHYRYWWRWYDSAKAANGLLIVFAAVAVVIGTWLGIVASKTVCCSSTQNQTLCIPVPCSSVGPMQYGEQNQSIIYVDPRQQMQQVPHGVMIQQQQQQQQHSLIVVAGTNDQSSNCGQENRSQPSVAKM